MTTHSAGAPTDTFLFDLGGVLIDWSPRYLFARHFAGDDAALDHVLTHVCPPEWNVTMDAGKPAHVGLAERIAAHPEHEGMIRRWFDEWPAMIRDLAGSAPKFPMRVADDRAKDLPRVPLA